MIDTVEALCPCGHTQDDHHFGCEALADEGCPCTAIYPVDGSAPWLPPGLRLPRVGDRVRVLPRPECEYCRDSEGEDGRTGRVYHPEAFADPDQHSVEGRAHPYWVEFDVPLPDGCRSPFAAIELEILAADDGGATTEPADR